MTEQHERRLAQLYRQASQETPPAHLDHAVMGLARKSLRRGLLPPFGGQWLAGVATVAVVVLSVMVVLTLPPADRSSAPEVGLPVPASQAPLMDQPQRSTPGRAAPAPYALDRELSEPPAAPATASDADDAMPAAADSVGKAENRVRKMQRSAPREEAAGLAAPSAPAGHYLWAGTFGERTRAERIKTAVDALGMDCDIEELHAAGEEGLYRVRVGPYQDPAELEQARKQLLAHGIDASVAVPSE